MDVQQAVGARHLGQLHVRQVDAEGGVAPVQIAQQTLGRELGDGFLRLLGRAADVGRQDDVLQPLQGTGEGVGVGARLLGEDVHRRAGDAARLQRLGQGVDIDDVTARQVQEQGARLHLRQLGRADDQGVVLAPVDMQADHVGLGQQGVQRAHAPGVAQGQTFRQVVEDDPHPQVLGQDRQLRADGAIADDAQGLAAQLARTSRRLVPLALVHGRRLVGHVAHQDDGQADGQFDHRAGVGIGGVEDGHAMFVGGLQIDLIGADAEGGDGQQAVGVLQHALADIGLGANAQNMDALDRLDQVVLVQRALHGLDGIARLLQPLDGGGVDVLQQQHLDAVARIGPAARHALGEQDLVQRGGGRVGDLDHLGSADDLGEGVEAVSRAGQLDLGVGPAVADHDHRAGQVQGLDDLRLAVVARQGVGVVHARHTPLGVIDQIIGQDVIGGDPQTRGQGGDHLAEAARQDIDPLGVALEEVDVAADRGAGLVQNAVRQGLDVTAGQGQQVQTAAQGRAEVHLTRHGLIGQGRDLGLAGGRIGGVGQGDVSERFKRLDAHQGGIEVEDEDGRSHAPHLAHLRTCSNKKGDQSPPFRTNFPKASQFAEIALAPAFQRGGSDGGGDGGHGQQGAALLGVVAGEVAGVLGIATRLPGVAFHRLARLLARAGQPVLGPRLRVVAEAPRPLAGVVAQIGGAVAQVLGAVADAARDVVEAMAQGLGVEPATRIDAFAQPLVAGRTRPLVQQEGGDPDPGQNGHHARRDSRVFADLVHGVELSNHGHSNLLLSKTIVRTGANRVERGSAANGQAARGRPFPAAPYQAGIASLCCAASDSFAYSGFSP
ncbi:hypothetical protein D3C80_858090 [compost metagenome]